MKNQLKNKDGFTIIEVVLVLAIAALIMLMVFIALPALQRSQRDTQRKDDISRLQAAVSNYTSTNRGKSPFVISVNSIKTNFVNPYLRVNGEVFADPLGGDYNIVASIPGSDPAGNGKIAVDPGGKCSEPVTSAGVLTGTTAPRSGAIRIKLESGGVHCLEY